MANEVYVFSGSKNDKNISIFIPRYTTYMVNVAMFTVECVPYFFILLYRIEILVLHRLRRGYICLHCSTFLVNFHRYPHSCSLMDSESI